MASSSLWRGVTLLLALFAIVGSAKIKVVDDGFAPFSQRAQLQQIRDSIQQQGAINAASVGSKLFVQIDVALHSGNLTVGYINATLTDTSLVVLAKARVWDAVVVGSFTFFFPTPTSTDVQLQLQFGATFDLPTVYRAVFPSGSAPSFLTGVKATEQLSVVLSTFDYNSYPAGLTVSSTSVLASPSSNVLAQALATLHSAPAATFGTNLFVPLYSANPTFIDLKLTEQGTFALTSNIECSAYQLTVSVSTATSFSLSTNLAVGVKNQAQPVSFSVSAQWKANTTASFSGSLTGAWNNPFGVNWFSIASASVSFNVNTPAKTDRLAISGTGVFSFAPGVTSPFSLTILNSGDFAVSVANLPVGSFGSLYSAVTRTSTPDIAEGIVFNGNVGFSLASFASGSIAQGLTLNAAVTLGLGSKLDKAAKTLAASSQKFSLTLFVPVYSSNVDNVRFTLAASGSFGLTHSITISGYTINVAISSQTTVGLSAVAEVALANQAQPLTFNLQANWQENVLTTFQGALQGTWRNPFGLGWLQFVLSVTLKVSVASGQASSAQVSITGTGTVASAPSSPFSFAINVKESGDWYFTVASFPLGTLSSFYSSVVGSSSAPAVLAEATLSGQASLALATYSSGSVVQGLTVSSTATVAGSLRRAAATLGAAPSQNYQLSLYVPLLGAQGPASLSISESGAIALTSHVQVNSFSVSVTFSATPVVTIGGQVAITIKEQSQPVVVQISGNWNDQSSTTTFSGQLSSWTHPLGLSWLTFQDLTVSLVISSEQVTQLSFSGKAALTFATSPVTASISFNNDGAVVLTVSNIPINTLIFMYQDVVRSTPPAFVTELNTIEGTVSFTVATASTGNVKRGLSLTAHTNLLAGSLTTAVKTLIASPSSVQFDLSLFIPIFDADPSAISLTLTESGSYQLSSNIDFQSFSLSLVVSSGQQTSISLGAQLAVSLAHQSQPVVFEIDGKWVESTSVSFNGQLVGQWNHPFGAQWLDITGASVRIVVQQGVVQELGFAGASVISFDSKSVSSSFAITTSNNFHDFTFVAGVGAQWSLSQIAKSLTGSSPVVVGNVNENSASLNLILTTYPHDGMKTGLTVQTKGTIYGELFQRVKVLQPKTVGNIQWVVALNVPLFTSNPADLSISLEIDTEVPITPDFTWEKLVLEVDAFPLAVSAESQFRATFTKNPPLLFDIDGQFSVDGSLTLTGEMIGTWENVFGFQGFDVNDVILEIGFNPAMCAVDGACLSDLGLGFNMSMGTKTIAFDGNVASPDFEDIFAKGSISGAHGMALTMLDVVLEWNKMFPHWQIPTSDVPANWGLMDTSFYFAPKDGTFGGIAYQEGFAFTGGIVLLDMSLGFTISCSPRNTDICDFDINVHLDFDLFFKMLKREVELRGMVGANGEAVVFSLDSLSLTQWSAKEYSAGVLPRWQIGLTVFGKQHHLNFEVQQWEMASSFSGFFDRWLKHIF